MAHNTMRSYVVLTLLLCTTQISAQAAQPCLEDVAACLPNLRDRLIDNDYYWFGTPYNSQCPGFTFCVNDRPDLQSVMSRIQVTNETATLQSAAANIQFLNVTFNRPATSYFACDMTVQVPAGAPMTLDPLQPAMLSQILVQTQPEVTWTPETNETLYTFIMYDCSYLFLHTLFINCPGGSLDGCEVVRPWLGSAAGYLINSAYTYVVYEQTDRVDIATAQQAVQITTAEGMAGSSSPLGAFYLSNMFTRLSSFYGPFPLVKFASVMEMYPDPYGSSRLTNLFNNIDQCPLFYSQLPAFHSTVQYMQIPNPKWSTAAFGYSQLATAKHLISVTVNVHVTYETDDFTDTACCKEFQLSRGTHMVSALDTRSVGAAMTRHAPRVFLSPVLLAGPGSGRNGIAAVPYTLLVVDVTPALDNSTAGTNLTVHWLVANIFASDFPTGTVVAPYSPPTPTNKPLALMFLLFAQSTPVNPSAVSQLCPNGPTMCQLQVTDLIATWSLGDIVGLNWFTSEEDGYSIKRQYTEMGMSEEYVCRGRDGYAKPCPAQQPCSAIGQIGFSHPYLIGQLAALVLVLNHFRA